jgi:hypothetical protein
VTGWTQLGVLVWIGFAVLAALLLIGILSVAWLLRRITAMWADEHAETHAQRQATTPERCWVSPDEELEFEEITAALRTSRHTREVPPC